MDFLRKIISRFRKNNGILFTDIQQLLGFPPKNIDFYTEAFTHPATLANKKNEKLNSYQRLEFLGDAVLGAIVAHYLFCNAPDQNEGYLTKMRSKVVRRDFLNKIGEELRLTDYLQIPDNQKVMLSEDLNGNLFEALVGAIFLDRGYATANDFVHKILKKFNVNLANLESKIISYKALLVEWIQKRHKKFAFVTEQDKTDSSGDVYFISKLYIDGQLFAKARETSKKRSEERASRRAFFKIHGRKK